MSSNHETSPVKVQINPLPTSPDNYLSPTRAQLGPSICTVTAQQHNRFQVSPGTTSSLPQPYNIDSAQEPLTQQQNSSQIHPEYSTPPKSTWSHNKASEKVTFNSISKQGYWAFPKQQFLQHQKKGSYLPPVYIRYDFLNVGHVSQNSPPSQETDQASDITDTQSHTDCPEDPDLTNNSSNADLTNNSSDADFSSDQPEMGPNICFRERGGFFPNVRLITDLQEEIRQEMLEANIQLSETPVKFKGRYFILGQNNILKIRTKAGKYKTFLPPEYVQSWVDTLHSNDEVAPHPGLTKTVKLLAKTADTFSSYKLLAARISGCHSCQALKNYAPFIHPPVGDTLIPTDINEWQNFDVCGPLHSRTLGVPIYILASIDGYSKYAFFKITTKPVTSEIIANFLLNNFLKYGAPYVIQSDGTSVNNTFELRSLAKMCRM